MLRVMVSQKFLAITRNFWLYVSIEIYNHIEGTMSNQKGNYFVDRVSTDPTLGGEYSKTFRCIDMVDAMNLIEDYLWDKYVKKAIAYQEYTIDNGDTMKVVLIELIKY